MTTKTILLLEIADRRYLLVPIYLPISKVWYDVVRLEVTKDGQHDLTYLGIFESLSKAEQAVYDEEQLRKGKTMRMQCLWCHQDVHYDAQRGWVHAGGGIYMIRCKECDWQGAPADPLFRCPQCFSTKLFDHHCVMPTKALTTQKK